MRRNGLLARPSGTGDGPAESAASFPNPRVKPMPIDELLEPIAEGAPCGEDLSFSTEFDEIVELRREDDASLPLGDWKEKGKDPKVADWPALCTLCEDLLRTRSKDLRLAGWLADGWYQQRGLAGLADGVVLCTRLVERYWEHVHPLPEDGDQEQRVGALRWLLARTVALVGLARHAPVVESRHADAKAAFDALARLQAAVDPKVGAEGPSFVTAREALKALVDDLPVEADAFLPATGDGSAAPAAPAIAAAAAAHAGPLQTRAQALHQLRQVADFFRRTEPHSPVAYLADKAAKWGAMDLHSWLRTVIKDGGSLAQLEELLGVEPPKS
jgi:type VI secretion system protein ImpA